MPGSRQERTSLHEKYDYPPTRTSISKSQAAATGRLMGSAIGSGRHCQFASSRAAPRLHSYSFAPVNP